MLLTLTLIFLLFVYLFIAFSAASKNPKAAQGILDLSAWNFEKDGVVSLDGEWEFYWDKLLTYQDFHDNPNMIKNYGQVPYAWNYYVHDGNKLPGFGYGTYRLRIKTNSQEPLSLKIKTISTAYKLMIDHDTLTETGTMSTDAATFSPEYRPQIVSFKQAGNEFEIIIQVANYTYARGGLWSSIQLGTDRQIHTLEERDRQKDFFLLGAIFIMALYHIAIFLLQRRYHFKAELYFVFLMLLFALRILFCGEYPSLLFYPVPVKGLVLIEYITICWAMPALALFVQELCPNECSTKILKTILRFAGISTLVIILTPLHVYTALLPLFEFLSVATALYYVYAAWLSMIHGRSGAVLLLSTVIFAICAFTGEIFYYWNIIPSQYGNIFPIVSLVFIFLQAFILAQRSSRAFADVQNLSTKLLSLDKIKDEFMANTSHELRTPLHGMIAITESVLESAGTFSPQQKENLSLVVSSGKRLANLINDILDYEKIKYDDIHLNKQAIDLKQIIPAALEVNKYLALSKPIAIVSDLPDDLPTIDADEDRVIQIIYNLLSNAVKFTEQGTIIVSAVLEDTMVKISIKDTGIGIPAGKLNDIFKSFEQLDTALTGRQSGTGLGLSITKYLVESHGGTIGVTSEPGKGSTFTFTMPVSITDQKKVYQATKPQTDHYTRQRPTAFKTPAYFPKDSNFTVLLVDDDYVNLQAFINILAAENYSAIAVTNGIDALKILSSNKSVDLVILDIMLPNMSGYEVCKKLRENYSLFELPVLMTTAQHSTNGILTGFAAGANDFLYKPFDSNELKARMKTLLQLKKSVSQTIQAEMAFLQAQIKPHFLYNALNTIMSFCWTDSEKAGELLLNLSEYLRGSFNFSNMNQFNTLEKELEFVEAYIAIEKARFEEKLNYQSNVTIPTDKLQIPTLMIQPIVENAIKHGILPKKDGGTVTLSIVRKSQDLLITIQDDGVGLPDGELAKLLSGPIGKSVGLTNINRRLKHLYGYGLHIESSLGIGTTVSIKIPYEEKDE